MAKVQAAPEARGVDHAAVQGEPNELTPRLMLQLLELTIPAGMPTLLTSAPGVGKSEIVGQACDKVGYELLVSYPVLSDPTDAKGLPWKVQGTDEAMFLPFGELKRAQSAKKPLVWFLDDFGQATPASQSSFGHLILARHKIPDCVTFIAATNRRTDRSGVTGILEHIKSRFVTIVGLTSDVDDWVRWAIDHEIAPEIISFLRFRRDLLLKFNPKADMKNSPCPRTWKHASDIIKADWPDALEHVALVGAVGPAAAGELSAYLRTYRNLPDLNSVLANPDTAMLPDDLSARYAISTALGTVANVKNFGRVLKYAERMAAKPNGAEFGVMIVRDCDRRDQQIQHTPEWTHMCADTVMGALISGDTD